MIHEDYTPGGPKNQNGNLRRLAIVVNGRLVVAPAIYAVITNGEFTISDNFSADEAIILAASLNPRNADD
jgi:preprotein translocase subunit SecD